MTVNNILNSLKSIKKGAFTRLVYRTDVRLSAKAVKEGYKVFKTTSMTTRFGINYNNLKSVKLRKSDENYVPSNKAPKFEKINEFIFKSVNNDTLYLVNFPTSKGRNSKSSYEIEKNGVPVEFSFELFNSLVTPSYFKNRSSSHDMLTIKVEIL